MAITKITQARESHTFGGYAKREIVVKLLTVEINSYNPSFLAMKVVQGSSIFCALAIDIASLS